MFSLFFFFLVIFSIFSAFSLLFTSSIYETLFALLAFFLSLFFFFIFFGCDFLGLVILILYLGAVLFFFIFVLMTIDLRKFVFEISENTFFKKGFFFFLFFFLFLFFTLFLIYPLDGNWSFFSSGFSLEKATGVWIDPYDSFFFFFPRPSLGLSFYLYTAFSKEIYFLSLLLFVSMLGALLFTKK